MTPTTEVANRDLAARPGRRTSRPRQRPLYQSANRRPPINTLTTSRRHAQASTWPCGMPSRLTGPRRARANASVLDARATGCVSGSTVRPSDFCSEPVVIGSDSDGLVGARATTRSLAKSRGDWSCIDQTDTVGMR